MPQYLKNFCQLSLVALHASQLCNGEEVSFFILNHVCLRYILEQVYFIEETKQIYRAFYLVDDPVYLTSGPLASGHSPAFPMAFNIVTEAYRKIGINKKVVLCLFYMI